MYSLPVIKVLRTSAKLCHSFNSRDALPQADQRALRLFA
jgi:hypothetical protein